jgi:uncharacterized protein YecE (DUF72 family)
MAAVEPVRVGVGGWTYEPWRGTFYPAGLPAKRELEHMSRRLTAVEVNGTFYRTQSAASFAKWREETPENFIFALKGHRAAVNKKKLAEAGETVDWFVKSGVAELGGKLGPILWQLAPHKQFDAEDIGAFLALLPAEIAGVPLGHAIEVRHDSFRDAGFIALTRKHKVAIVYADSDDYPAIADDTAGFVYARLMRTVEEEPAGYSSDALDQWAARARVWAAGGVPENLPRVASAEPAGAKRSTAAKGEARPVFMFFIAGAKVRAPAAAEALIARLRR